MRWATRAGVHIDRAACAWLLRRFIDPEADLADDRYDAPEAPGLDVVLRGLSMAAGDQEVIDLAGRLFDGLYEHRRRALLLGKDPA